MSEIITKLSALEQTFESETKFIGEPEQTNEGRRSSLRWSYATPKFNKTGEEMLKELPNVYPTLVNCANYSKLAYDASLSTGTHEMIKTKDMKYFEKQFPEQIVSKLDVLKVFKVGGVLAYIGRSSIAQSVIVSFKADLDLGTPAVDYKSLTNVDALKGLKVLSSLQEALAQLEKFFHIIDTVKDTLKENPYKLFIVGHSTGGSLASLFGFEAQNLGLNPSVITFGAPKLGYDTNPTTYLKKIVTLFDITSDSIDRADMSKNLNNKRYGFFVNVEAVGDLISALPVGPYQRLGGIPFFIKQVGTSDYPQFLYTQDVDYRLNSRVAKRQGLRYNKGVEDSKDSLDAKLLKLLGQVDSPEMNDIIKSNGTKNDYYFIHGINGDDGESLLKSKL
jgi:hypothetical protein